MKATNYDKIDGAIKLHLEYNQVTIGEISNILRQWQALLRSVWREYYLRQYGVGPPNARVLLSSASTEHSCDVLCEFAIPALYFATAIAGPVTDWPDHITIVYSYLFARLRGYPEIPTTSEERIRTLPEARGRYPAGGSETQEGGLFIQTANGAVMELDDVTALADDAVGQRIENLLTIANGGSIDITIEALHEPRDEPADPE